MTTKPVLVMYLPVLHQGYIHFFWARITDLGIRELYVVGDDLIAEANPLHREIRAVGPKQMRQIMSALGYFPRVHVLTKKNVNELREQQIVCPQDFLLEQIANKYFRRDQVTFYDDHFLRWDEANISKTTVVDYESVSSSEFDRQMIELTRLEGSRSSDWWRQIGALAVKDGVVMLRAHNHHVPSELTPYIEGDPRDVVPAGTHSEISTALHAEQSIITQAAAQGIGLAGCDIYTTMFPCPMCAKQVAFAGFKRLFFAEGHTSLDGEQVLKSQGVKIILVQ